MEKLKQILLFTAFVASGTGILGAAEPFFQGEVDYDITQNGSLLATIHYQGKGHLARFDINAKEYQYSVIKDADTSKRTVLMPQQKQYLEVTRVGGKTGTGGGEGTITQTGKTDTVLGQKCEEWLYKGKEGKVSIWAAAQMGAFIPLNDDSPDPAAVDEAILKKGLFPLKMVYWDASGNADKVMAATKIERKVLDAGLFTPPPGYQLAFTKGKPVKKNGAVNIIKK